MFVGRASARRTRSRMFWLDISQYLATVIPDMVAGVTVSADQIGAVLLSGVFILTNSSGSS